ncbi:MAG: epoxyqueuosine reductase [Desulfobacteraceae bacterium]|nr:epoxyqueuosine reductase [Desulfobacteraceae bacterium]
MNPIAIADLKKIVEQYVAGYPDNTGEPDIWRTPLVATTTADERFEQLRQMAANDHAMPWDLLPSAATVVVIFIPFKKSLAVENRPGDVPSRQWGLAYESTNRLINTLCVHLKGHLETQGFETALTPATHNFDRIRLVSRWSHKHLGYMAGLGRFGVNAQFITPAGCAGRLGSLVTSAEYGNNPLVHEEELCLYKKGQECLACVKRCPVDAVSVTGIDRKRCWERLNHNLHSSEQLKGLSDSTHVCGKCQVLVPCSLKIPRKSSSTDRVKSPE